MTNNRKRLATSSDVAEAAGVSRATVSNVFSGSRYVSPDLSARVKNAALELKYQPHGIARSLVAHTTKSVGLLVPRIFSTFYPPIISAVEQTLGRAGYSIILCESTEDPLQEEKMVRVLAEKRVDGFIWVPCGEENLSLMGSLAESGFPVVVVDRSIHTDAFDMVVSDNERAGQLGAEYLLGLGYRRISILTFSQKHAPARERLLGFRKAHQSAGVPVDESLVCVAGTPEYQSAGECLANLLKGSRAPQAILACSDLLTLAALQESRRAGLAIPRDIAIIGFDDSPWAAFVDPPLTVLTQDATGLGKQAAGLLLKRLSGKRQPRPQIVKLPISFVKRSSCSSVGELSTPVAVYLGSDSLAGPAALERR